MKKNIAATIGPSFETFTFNPSYRDLGPASFGALRQTWKQKHQVFMEGPFGDTKERVNKSGEGAGPRGGCIPVGEDLK